MRKRTTHRLIALLCVFCMLFTSIPSSVMSENDPATPTDLKPVVQEQENQIPKQDTPGQENLAPEQGTPEDAEKSGEQVTGNPEEGTAGTAEASAVEIQKPPADRDLIIGDALTINGTKEGKKDYLIRFTPAESQSMYLILTSDKRITAVLTDEATGTSKKLQSAEKDENDKNILQLADCKVEMQNSYLVIISGEETTDFSFRVVRKSIYLQELEDAQKAAEELKKESEEETDIPPAEEPVSEEQENPEGKTKDQPAEVPEDDPVDNSVNSVDNSVDNAEDNPLNKPVEEPAGQPVEKPTEEPDEEPAEEPTEQLAGDPTQEPEGEEPVAEEREEDKQEETTEPAAGMEPSDEEPGEPVTLRAWITGMADAHAGETVTLYANAEPELTGVSTWQIRNEQVEDGKWKRAGYGDHLTVELAEGNEYRFVMQDGTVSEVLRPRNTAEGTAAEAVEEVPEGDKTEEGSETADQTTEDGESAENGEPAEETEDDEESTETEESDTESGNELTAKTEEPEEEPSDESENTSDEEPVNIKQDKPEEEMDELPAEDSEEDSVDNPVDKPVDNSPNKPADEPAEQPVEKSNERPAEELAEAPAEVPVEVPVTRQLKKSATPATPTDLTPVEEKSAEEIIPATPTDLKPVENEPERRETPATPTDLAPVEIRLNAEGSAVDAWIVFPADAGIPEGTELRVRELNVEEQKAYQAQTAQALSCDDESYLRYTKYLELSLIHEGETLDIHMPMTVYVALPDIREGAEALQAVRFNEREPMLLDSKLSGDTIAFRTETLAVFGIGNALMPLTAKETELAAVEVLGFSPDAPVSLTEAEDPEVIEGLEVLGTFSVENNTKAISDADAAGQDGLWIRAGLKDGAELDPMEGVALYRVEEDGRTDVLMEALTENARIMELDAEQVAVVKDTGYRHMTLTLNLDENNESQSITLDGMMPKGAEAVAEDVTERFAEFIYITEVLETETESETETQTTRKYETELETEDVRRVIEITTATEDGTAERTTLAAFNITISNGTEEYQPNDDKPIAVEIVDSRITTNGNIELWHIKGDGTHEQIFDFTLEEGRIRFEATGFSAYAIVEGPGSTSLGCHQITTTDDFDAYAANGIYVGHSDGFYFTNEMYIVKNNRTGIRKTQPSQPTPTSTAALYYFEKVEGTTDQYYAYCFDTNGVKKYVNADPNTNSLKLVSEESRTAFTVSLEGDKWTVQYDGRYWNQQGHTSGSGFAIWNENNIDSKLELWYNTNISNDPYDLDGKAYGLMNWNNGVSGRAMMASETDSALEAKVLTVMIKQQDRRDKIFVPNSAEIDFWTFEWVEQDLYYLKATDKYLKIEADGLDLVDTPDDSCKIQVVPGTGDKAGQICLKQGNNALTYSGNAETGFSVGGSVGSEWLYLLDESELTPDYYMIYSADKVSVSDSNVTNGSKVIVYTRVWNDTTKQYEFYAIDHDGSLVRVFENGDTIQWVGQRLNSMLWNFVEYMDGDKPNYFYELFNEYSEKYITPQIDGQMLSGNANGINLNGRRNGAYYSTILAWDGTNYAYAGIKAEDLDTDHPHIASCVRTEADDFYFAIVQDVPTDDELGSGVSTIDNRTHGITMKMVNFGGATTKPDGADTTVIQDSVMGNSHYSASDANRATSGLLSTDLKSNGYPMATLTNKSLSELFGSAEEVNHLFIASTYYSSGYYQFDSSQNFAHLESNKNFTVYKELGTHDSGNKPSLKHGQFFPYNTIEAGVFASVNRENLYTATQNLLPESDPRKYEKLYLINKPDYFFGMELSASFTQTPSGKDNWGHDIIYEFTGDDDFWLYVDGELVIDLGGIHSALGGKVNYSTGEVVVNGTHTTLKEIFYNNYLNRENHTEAEAQAYVDDIFEQNENGQWVFKDYSTHTMKIFFMERGAGASNLRMRFNLASVKPGHVLLSKELDGIDQTETQMVEFPYQIYYDKEDNQGVQQLVDSLEDIHVYYKDTTKPVTFKSSVTIGGTTYDNVFILKPGETADISVPDDTIKYRIVECGVDTDIFKSVKVKEINTNLDVMERTGTYKDYGFELIKMEDRPQVTYINEVDSTKLGKLNIKKELYRPKSDGSYELIPHAENQEEFEFRLYLAPGLQGELTDDDLTNMQTYHVKDENGDYCRWDASEQKFVTFTVNGNKVSDFASLTDAQKELLTFQTSIYGSISNIPNGYTVEVRELMPGTLYKVVERPWNIPDGYSFWKYYDGSIELSNATNGISGTITAGGNPQLVVKNIKGFGLRINKQWSDEDYMEYRAPTYFAVYCENNGEATLVENTVKRLEQADSYVYWYFEKLPSGTGMTNDLDHYVAREVTLSDFSPVVNEDGYVTNYSEGNVTRIENQGTVTLSGRLKGQSVAADNTYTVTYAKGTMTTDSNIRIDTVLNDRPGIELKKTDWAGDPLANATFTLTREVPGGDPIVIGPYTSDAAGSITRAYLEKDVDYTLTETDAPTGYYGLQGPLTLRVTDQDGLNVTSTISTDSGCYDVTQANEDYPAAATVKNRALTFEVLKLGGEEMETATPLEGVTFELYKEITVNGVSAIDVGHPMEGFDQLSSDVEGIVALVNQTLEPGTYELHEKAVPSGYQSLSLPQIKFTISPLGEISLNKTIDGVELVKQIETVNGVSTAQFRLKILNHSAVNMTIKKMVAGEGDTTQDFTFKLTAVEKQTYGTLYAWTKYDANGQVLASTSNATTPAAPLSTKDGENTFTLKHGESISIEVPRNRLITVNEIPDESEGYITSWSSTVGTPTSGYTNEIKLSMGEDATVTITNSKGLVYVAPTGFTLKTTPYLLMMLAGFLLIAGFATPAFLRKRRRDRTPVQEALRMPNPAVSPPCPGANLWAQPKGPPGKRGDPV